MYDEVRVIIMSHSPLVLIHVQRALTAQLKRMGNTNLDAMASIGCPRTVMNRHDLI